MNKHFKKRNNILACVLFC